MIILILVDDIYYYIIFNFYVLFAFIITQAKDLDEILHLHNQFLDELSQKCFLNEKVFMIYNRDL